MYIYIYIYVCILTYTHIHTHIQTYIHTNINTYMNIFILQKSSTSASGKYHVLEISFHLISEVVKNFGFKYIFRKIIIKYLCIVCKCSAYNSFPYQRTRIFCVVSQMVLAFLNF